jgi:hypothetical protein
MELLNALGTHQGNLTEGEYSPFGLLVLTTLDQLLFILKILFTFVTKQATLMYWSTVQSFTLWLVFLEAKFLIMYEWLMIELSTSCERGKYELFWYS